MDSMADRFADRGVTSVFVYTREAHPAEHYRHHRSMEEKRGNARAMIEHTGMRRAILIDDLVGTAHRGFGLLPNMSFIIGKGGMILYKAAWTEPEDIEDALVRALDYQQRRRADNLTWIYSERLAWRKRDSDSFREGLERNGAQAVTDFYGES